MRLTPARRSPAGSLSHPSSLPGCFLSLEADTITGIADAGSITTWSDLSLLGNNQAQSVALQKPTFETNEIGTLPIVRFTALLTQTLQKVTASGVAGTNLTYGIVFKRNTISTTQGLLYNGTNTAGSSLSLHTDDTVRLLKTNAAVIAASSTTITSTSVYNIVIAMYNGSRADFSINGVAAGGGTSAQVFTTSDVGIGTVNGSSPLDADVAAAFMANVVLSAADLKRLTRYWSGKWNVTLG